MILAHTHNDPAAVKSMMDAANFLLQTSIWLGARVPGIGASTVRSARFWRHGWGNWCCSGVNLLEKFYFSIFSSFKQHSMVTEDEFKDAHRFMFSGEVVVMERCESFFSSVFYVGPYRNTGDFELLYGRYWCGGERLFSTVGTSH